MNSEASRHPVHGWLDITAGVAGDMVLGALVDAGADLDQVQSIVDAVLPATVRLSATTVTRAGLRACKVDVEVLVDDQPERRWADIAGLLTDAEIPAAVRATSLAVFERLAAAEARVHGISPQAVHFHEVGAWDSIADVVGVAVALDLLGVTSVSASRVALGSGRVHVGHGDLPVPAPATLELSVGWEAGSDGRGELATPTGMALVRTLATTCEPMPTLTLMATGVGAGSLDTPERANVVRVVLGTGPVPTPPQESLTVLEANVDDLDPRVWPEVLGSLLDAGAADAWLTPIIMKKGRPAHTLSVLCAPARRDHLREVMFGATTTFGIRELSVGRVALERSWRSVRVGDASVRIKISLDDAGRIRHATPEFEDARAASRAAGAPVRRVLDEAAAAAYAAGIRVGEECPPAPDPPG